MKNSIMVRCGQLFDGVKEELYKNVDILIDGTRIAKVGKDLSYDSGTQIIDLTNMTVTPGMIDAHTHLSFFEWQKRDYEQIYCSETWKGMAVLYNAERALRRGFTTLRFVGCSCNDGYSSIDAKKVIKQGYFIGSDLVVAPYYTGSVGGMADYSRSFSGNPVLANRMAFEYPGVGAGRNFFISCIREQVKMGADFIKLMASGGFSSPTGSPEDVQLFNEEYEAIISTAHQMNIPVTAHAYTPDIMQNLVRLSIDGIEHGSLMDEETARMIEEKNIYLVPTFCQYDEIIHMDEESLKKREPKEFRDKLQFYGKQLIESRELIKNSKIKLGYGTDMLDIHPCYECGYEYASWLRSGFDPFRALKAATSVNAEIVRQNDIGVIAVGKRANIAAWEHDLISEPNALLDCAFVMKDGIIYDTERTNLESNKYGY